VASASAAVAHPGGSNSYASIAINGATARYTLHRLADRLHAARIVERREVAGVLAELRRADDPAHDLGAARLR
jgi:hypothetical protein